MTRSQPKAADPRGVRIGRYLVTGRIGRGGMGMVYRCLDEALEREVAVKTLNQEYSGDGDGLRRFENEAKAVARLQHPNIVTVYELEQDRGVHYIAMEMLPGADLEAVLRGGGEPLSLGEKLDVMAQVCRGLASAHEQGIIHRDVKPSNIRLLDDGTVKLMDFGIAKLVGATHLTKTGMMVGTVHYMSPEQVRGRPLDGRSDVFSVGVILYELLAGERPFRGEGATQVLYRIVNEEPRSLPLEGLGEIGPRLCGVVARALAKDREARYPTARALADELSRLVEEVQRAKGAPPATAVQAVADARQLLRAGDAEPAIAMLRATCESHPEFLDARRALRAALRDQKRRRDTPPPSPDGYPELEATFLPAATRLERETQLQPTVALEVPGAGRRARGGRRTWPWAALALVLLAAGSAVLLPRAGRRAAGPVRVPVHSQPVGAAVLVDGRDSGVVTNGELVLQPPAPAQVVLTFRKAGHRDETRPVRLPLGEGDVVSVALQASQPVLTVRTDPPGASLAVDGERVSGTTPLELALDPAREHRLVASLEGYLPQEVRLPAGDSRAEIALPMPKLAPPGTVAVSSAYPLDVLWHGKPLARGSLSPRVSVAGGRQALTLLAPAVFLRGEVTVEVASGGEVAVEAPALGRLNVRASPDNCEVFVDGAFVDYPPILDRPAVVGHHTIGFRWPDGRRSEQAVEVEGGAPAFAFGRKEKE